MGIPHSCYNRSRKFEKQVDGNCLVQVLKELSRNGALPDLLLVNSEGLMSEVVRSGHLSPPSGEKSHQLTQLWITQNTREFVFIYS